jgi:hypothetical protein
MAEFHKQRIKATTIVTARMLAIIEILSPFYYEIATYTYDMYVD